MHAAVYIKATSALLACRNLAYLLHDTECKRHLAILETRRLLGAMAKGNTEELCEYLNVKSARIVDKEEQADQSAAGLNGRLFKVSCVA